MSAKLPAMPPSAVRPRLRPLLAALLCLALLTPAPAQMPDAALADRIVAWVDDEALTLSELEEAHARYRSEGLSDGGEITETALRRSLERWIDEILILRAAAEQGIEAPREKVERRVGEMMRSLERRYADREGGFEALLTETGQSREDLRRQIRDRLEREWILARAIDRRIEINEADLQAFRQERQSQGLPTERYRLAQLFIPLEHAAPDDSEATRAMIARSWDAAEELADKARLEAGRADNFLQAMRDFLTRHPGLDARAERLGHFDPDELRPDILEAVRNLQPGQCAPPLRGDQGIHLIHLEDKTSARDILYAQRYEETRRNWAEELRANHTIQIADTLYAE